MVRVGVADGHRGDRSVVGGGRIDRQRLSKWWLSEHGKIGDRRWSEWR
jgi:hypothetical protein